MATYQHKDAAETLAKWIYNNEFHPSNYDQTVDMFCSEYGVLDVDREEFLVKVNEYFWDIEG